MTSAPSLQDTYANYPQFRAQVLDDPAAAIRQWFGREGTKAELAFCVMRQQVFAFSLLWRYNPDLRQKIIDAQSAKDEVGKLNLTLSPDEQTYLDKAYATYSPEELFGRAMKMAPMAAMWYPKVSEALPFADPGASSPHNGGAV